MTTPAERMDALYASLPGIECKRLCRECCGPIVQTASMSRLEYERVAAYPEQPFNPKDFMACSLLTPGGLCSAYTDRPMVCRLWGLVDTPVMRCPFGCVPERWLTDAEGRALLRESMVIGGVPEDE